MTPLPAAGNNRPVGASVGVLREVVSSHFARAFQPARRPINGTLETRSYNTSKIMGMGVCGTTKKRNEKRKNKYNKPRVGIVKTSILKPINTAIHPDRIGHPQTENNNLS